MVGHFIREEDRHFDPLYIGSALIMLKTRMMYEEMLCQGLMIVEEMCRCKKYAIVIIDAQSLAQRQIHYHQQVLGLQTQNMTPPH
jgi:hypothetical protein